MSIHNSFKRVQISASVTFLLVLLVSILTFFANYQMDTKQSRELPIQVAGGSATGNAIEKLIDQPEALPSHSSPVEYQDSFPDDPFAHLFQEEEVPSKLHYRSSLSQAIDYTPPSDTLSSDEFTSWINKLSLDSNRLHLESSQGLLIGSTKPYHIVVRGNTVLSNLQDITLTGFQFIAKEGVSLTILNSQGFSLRSSRIIGSTSTTTKSPTTGLKVQNSSQVNLLELEIHHHHIGIQSFNNDFSSDLDKDDYFKIQRSLIHHNDTGIQIIDGHGLILSNNLIAHNQHSISIDQRKPTLIHQADAIEGFKNVFYQSPIELDVHYKSDFVSNNILHLDYKKSKIEALAWYWLAH